MTYKEFKENFSDKKERKSLFCTWLKMRIKELWNLFIETAFVKHMSFLWHWKNFFFCLKYPFWKSKNVWNGKFLGYSFTWYDYIPKGWQIAFGKQLSDDIKKAGKATKKRLGKHIKWEKLISWEQIKEKYGELCLYASASSEIRDVLDKYELMSTGYCIYCGKPARYRTKDWISYQCGNCFKAHLGLNVKQDMIEKELEDCRLTKEDIPKLYDYEYKLLKTETFSTEEECTKKFEELWDNLNRPKDEVYIRDDYSIEYQREIKHIVNLKEKYNIDFKELWGL